MAEAPLRPVVRERDIPAHDLLQGFVADYADAYEVSLPPGAVMDPDLAAARLLGGFPGWVRWLLGVRNAVVRPFGLKTGRGPVPQGPRAGPFAELGRTHAALLAGEEDRHLSFRVLILIEPGSGGDSLSLTTLVHFHHVLGRVYFGPVLPMHRLIVKALLGRAARSLARAI